jgi:hypothetical protein
MGFNFGAFLGGAASQIVEDIDEQEKEIKLRTRTILDRQVAEAVENRKKFQNDKEKVEKQINSIAQLFDADDPFRFNKARAIVAGGDDHYNTMYKELSTHKKLGGSMKEAYDYTHANEEQGFETVQDAAKGLAKLRSISTPEISTGVTTKGMQLFGIDPKRSYEQAKLQYVQAGLLPSDDASKEDIQKEFGKGSIRYDRLMKAPKDLESQLGVIATQISELDKTAPDYKDKLDALNEKKDTVISILAKVNEQSATVQAANIAAGSKDDSTDKDLTFSKINTGFNSIVSNLKTELGYSTSGGVLKVTGPDGLLTDKEASDYFNSKVREAKKNYVKGLLDSEGNIKSEGSSNWIATNNAQDLVEEILVEKFGKKEEKTITDEPKKITKKEKVKKLISDNPEVNETVARNLLDLSGKINNAMQLSDMLMQTYPKKADESQDAYEERMDNLAKIVWSKYTQEKEAEDAEKKRLAKLRKERFGDTTKEGDPLSASQKRARARKGSR